MELISKTFITDQARRKEIEFFEDFVDYIREKAFLEHEVKNIREEMKELDKRNKALEKEIKKKTTENIKRKAALTGMDASSDRAEALVNTLENKLSQARMGLNQIITTCKEYRKEIDDCLTERQKFRVILENVTSKLKMGKACMLDMLEQAAVATAKRELAKDRLKRLVAEHKKVTSKQAYMYRELHSNIGVLIDRAMFQSVKIQRRVMKGLEAKRQLSALIKRQDVENQILQAKLTLNHIKHLYRVNDYHDVALMYNISSSLIMSLFYYAVYTFDLADRLHKSDAILLFKTDKLKQIKNDLIEEEAEALQTTFYEYNSLKEEVDNLNKKLEYAKTLKEFTILRLNMMFTKAGGNIARYSHLLGDNTKITAENSMLLVKEIERKMVELVGTLYMAERMMKTEELPLKRYLLYLPRYEETYQSKMKFYGLFVKTPCPVCAEADHFGLRKETKDIVEPFEKMAHDFISKAETEEIKNQLHSVSHCHLPGSRRLLQQRFLKLGY